MRAVAPLPVVGGRLILLWAFWFSSAADPTRMEGGWVVMPTQEACERARQEVLDMASARGGSAGLSSCRSMTPEELERQGQAAPSDASVVIFGH